MSTAGFQAASGPSSRVDWIDIARGGSIILVVFQHSMLAGQQIGEMPGPILLMNVALSDIRMPLFFFCSGLLAHWGLQKPWREILRRRIWVILWILVLWTGLHLLVNGVVDLYPWAPGDYQVRNMVWEPYGNIWFLYAILILTIVMSLLRRFSLPLQMAGVVLFAVGVNALVIGNLPQFPQYSLLDKVADYAIFCFAGGYWLAKAVIGGFASVRRAFVVMLCGLAVWIPVRLAAHVFLDENVFVPQMVYAVPALAVALGVARITATLPALATPLRHVGGRTLEIFLLHQIFIAVSFACLPALGITDGAMAGLFIFVCAMAGSIGVAHLVGGGLDRLLFRSPAIWRLRAKPVARA